MLNIFCEFNFKCRTPINLDVHLLGLNCPFLNWSSSTSCLQCKCLSQKQLHRFTPKWG